MCNNFSGFGRIPLSPEYLATLALINTQVMARHEADTKAFAEIAYAQLEKDRECRMRDPEL